MKIYTRGVTNGISANTSRKCIKLSVIWSQKCVKLSATWS